MFKDDVQLRDYLAKKAFYTTSTQRFSLTTYGQKEIATIKLSKGFFLLSCRLYEGADWDERITSSQLAPKTSKEVHADPVSLRVESKRYAPSVEGWQVSYHL